MTRIDFVTGAPERYAHLVDQLATAPERLRDVMAAVPPQLVGRGTVEGEWSIHRILAHMALFAERNGVFIHQMATMTDPERLAFDEEAESQRLEQLRPTALVDHVEREIGRTVALLSRTPDASWGRPGLLRGQRRSLRQQVEAHAAHMHEHVDQIAALLST